MRWLLAALRATAVVLLAAGCGGSGNEQAAETAARTVTHAMGTAEISGEPERIVGLDYDVLDTLTALGLEPAGGTEAIAGLASPPTCVTRSEA